MTEHPDSAAGQEPKATLGRLTILLDGLSKINFFLAAFVTFQGASHLLSIDHGEDEPLGPPELAAYVFVIAAFVGLGLWLRHLQSREPIASEATTGDGSMCDSIDPR